MIANLREAYPEATDDECALREKHMARALTAVFKRGCGSVALVCGAWHAAALPSAVDKALSRGLCETGAGYASAKTGIKAVKLAFAYIPWTYERLRSGGGYGAGVVSPTWYELLYRHHGRATEEYLTRIARRLREGGYNASTAQVVDAVELAESLRDLRGLALAGLDEIQEAALGAMAKGVGEVLAKAMREVEGSGTSGRVPGELSALPLQKDLELRLKTVRLAKVYRDMVPVERDLDLRKEAHLAASQLICQLLLLDIPFGERLVDGSRSLGTFKERWRLHWRPDFAVTLITAHRYGQTIDAAARAALYARLDAAADLLELIRAIDLVIVSGLYGEMDAVARRISAQAADTTDVWVIARALPDLLRVGRYHSLRVSDVAILANLNATLLPKLAAGLSAACRDIDEDAAYEGFALLKALQPYLAMVEEGELRQLWFSALSRLTYAPQTHALLRGFAHRTLVDVGEVIQSASANLLSQLATGTSIGVTAHFLEGFLYSGVQVLIHQPQTLRLISDWLASVSLEDFRRLLPGLRRSFGAFSKSERRRLGTIVSKMLEKSDKTRLSGENDALATNQPTTTAVEDSWIATWLGA